MRLHLFLCLVSFVFLRIFHEFLEYGGRVLEREIRQIPWILNLRDSLFCDSPKT